MVKRRKYGRVSGCQPLTHIFQYHQFAVPPDLSVGHLIDIETGQWNEHLIDDIFLAHEAEIIKTFL